MRRPHQHGYQIPERPGDIRIRFDDYGVSAEARVVVLAFHALSPEEREQAAGDGRITSPRARAVVERMDRLSGSELSALARFLDAVEAARSAAP